MKKAKSYMVAIVLVDEKGENERFTLNRETFSTKREALAAFRKACETVKAIYKARRGFWMNTEDGGKVMQFYLRSPYSPYNIAYVHLVVM